MQLVSRNGKKQVAVSTGDSVSFVNYAFVATGRERIRVENLLPFPVGKLTDSEGNITAIGDEDVNVAILGSGADLTLSDYPQSIQNIINALGIPENTISFWVNALLVERYFWSWLEKNGVNKEKVSNLIKITKSLPSQPYIMDDATEVAA